MGRSYWTARAAVIRPPAAPVAQNRRPSVGLLNDVPVRFFAFDVMAVDDRDVTAEPYWRRRRSFTTSSGRCPRHHRGAAGVHRRCARRTSSNRQRTSIRGILCKAAYFRISARPQPPG